MKTILSLLIVCFASVDTLSASSPNIIVVLADDLGYGDLACYGNDVVKTPHLDQFAKEGVRFTDCYAAAANCSPSRAGLMTGRTPWRVGIHNWIPMMSPMHVQESEITVATLLQQSGYETCHVGKWHLNGLFNLPGQPQPDEHGFDHWFSVQNNALPNHRNPYNFVRNGIPVGEIEGFSAGIVTDEAIRWMNHERKSDKPFFMFVCYHEPHEPIATADEYSSLYSHLEDPAERALWGNISQLDAGFGRLIAELDRLKLRENTIVFFTSDNGPALTGKHPYGSTGALWAKKGYVWEGGIRVPGILQWPGVTEPGSVSGEPISGVDVLPTICEITGTEIPKDRAIDGASLVPLLKGGPLVRETPLYWHFLRSRGAVKVAIREGDWKLLAQVDCPDIRPGGGITAEDNLFNRIAELEGFALYNLRSDITESSDVSAENPALFKEMKARLVAKYREVRDESPQWPLWEFPKYEGKRIEWPEYKALRKPPGYKR